MWKRSLLLFSALLLALLALTALPAALGAPIDTPAATSTPQPADALLIGTPAEDLHNITDAGVFNLVPGYVVSGLQPSKATLWSQDVLSDGAEANDGFATVMVSGDFNGDGLFDVAVGIPNEDWESWDGFYVEPNAGAVNVIYNTPHGLDAAHHQFWTQNETGVGVSEEGDGFGASLAVGDFNGDHYDDLAIGAPYEDLEWEGETITNAGVVFVLYGSPAGLTTTLTGCEEGEEHPPNLFTARDIITLGGFAHPAPYEHFGAALASGDFDEDGRSDLAIGIPNETNDVNGHTDAGAVAELLGDGAGCDGGLYYYHSRMFHQPVVKDFSHFGATLVAANVDGILGDDLVVGVPQDDVNGQGDAGSIVVLFGEADTGGLSDYWALQLYQEDLRDWDGNSVETSEGYEYFGYALAAGDFDHDGTDDIVVSTPYEDNEGSSWGTEVGVVHVLMGAVNDPLRTDTFTWYPFDTGSHAGMALSVGDYNGDGYDDFAVGLPDIDYYGADDAGEVDIFYSDGSIRPDFPTHQTISSSNLPNNALEEGDRLGSSLATLPAPLHRLYLPLILRH